MPDRDRNTVTQRITLGDGQINLNGTVIDVNGITLTQDGIEAARIEGNTLFRLDNDAEFTATATVNNYDEYEATMRRLMDTTRAATTATTSATYNPYFTPEDLQRLLDRVAETPHTYAVPAQDIQLGVDLAHQHDGFDARTYVFDNPWVTYSPYMYAVTVEDEEPELDEKNDKLDGFLGEFIKEAV